jgi:hypothetical protein
MTNEIALINDRWVTIRPIRSTDAAIEMDFVHSLRAQRVDTRRGEPTVRCRRSS